ncbi:MAG: stalk domain-containing protein [Oscillospiraceae bacterium]|nr:stalk domain-containing protein [Oscillospiraceae bacterium]
MSLRKIRNAIIVFILTFAIIPILAAHLTDEASSLISSAVSLQSRFDKTIILTLDDPVATVDGREIVLDSAPFLREETTMVPLRFIAQDILDAVVNWDAGNVIISNDGARLVIDLEAGTVRVDGETLNLTQVPEIKDDRTFVPLRMIAELFDCYVGFDGETGTITIRTPIIRTPPIADFSLVDTLTAGQRPTYSDLSYDPDGGTITYRIWRVTRDGTSLQGAELSHLVGSRPEPGRVLVQLRVRNDALLWSEWHQGVYLTILPNLPPQIVGFRADSSHVDIGEALSFSFDIENEFWEEIIEHRWTYSRRGDLRVRVGQPRAFFEPGVLEVSLVVTDAFGNVSQAAMYEIRVSNNVRQDEMQFRFQNLIPGDRFYNSRGINFNSRPQLHLLSKSTQPMTLIASNNPETVDSAGILYRDRASGHVRIHYHHINVADMEMYIAVFATNNGSNPVTLTVNKRGAAGPSEDPMQIGQRVNVSYFENNESNDAIVIAPGQTVVLNHDRSIMRRNQVLAGLIDLYATSTLQFTVAAITENISTPNYDGLMIHDREDVHLRGTFTNANFKLNYHTEGEQMQKIIIGRDDAFAGYFQLGVDALMSQRITNFGNWGVVYEISITADSRIGVLLNPRGTIFMGALIGFEDEIVLIPNSGHLAGSREAVVLGIIEAGETRTLTYVAPGGSDTPFLLVLVPDSYWSDAGVNGN